MAALRGNWPGEKLPLVPLGLSRAVAPTHLGFATADNGAATFAAAALAGDRCDFDAIVRS